MTFPQAELTIGTDGASVAPTRKVISLMHVSLDGFTAGPNGELEWAIVDEEMMADGVAMLSTVDTALYGRVTYQMMESFWPTVPTNPASTKGELQHAYWVENVQKIVFSKTLEQVGWNNTRLVKGDITEEIARLKQQPGKNMMIFGSPSITHTFTQLGLIDEYRIYLDPIVLGNGIPLFNDVKERMQLKLLEARTYRSGVIGLHYGVASAGDAQ
jgi:dihydrofolate reductase